MKLIDKPNERSLHKRLTPRGGGLGFVAVFLVGWPVALALTTRWPAMDVWWLVLLGVGIAAVSVADDRSPIPATLRLIVHIAFAAGAVTAVGYLRLFDIPFLGHASLGLFGGLLTILWILGLTNVTNFMDGIDGIAGVQGMIAGIGWALGGVWLGNPEVAIAGALIAGGCGGFLIHNWSPAQIFMGDVGSAFLGFMLAMLPVVAAIDAVVVNPDAAARLPVFGGILMWPFIGDGVFTFIRRLRKREDVLKAHRSHLYQRLVLAGRSHARVSMLYGAWAVLMGGSALAYLQGWVHLIAVVLLAIGSLWAMWRLVLRAEARPQQSSPE